MSQHQLHQYFKRHRKLIDRLLEKLEKRNGKNFPEMRLFQEMLNGFEVLEQIIGRQEGFYKEKIEQLNKRIKELEGRLHLDPTNSNKAPSTSRNKKIKNLRQKSGKKMT